MVFTSGMPWLPLPTPDGNHQQEPIKLHGLLDKVLDGMGGPSVDALVIIHERWADIVGSEVAQLSSPVSIESKVLRIRVLSAGWATHLQWSQRDILRRLDEMLGEGTVTALKIRVGRA